MRNATNHRLRVKAVVPETPDVVSIVVEGRALSRLRAQPGQFFRWRFLTPDLWRTAHPFSLSAPPTDTELRLTVKSLGNSSTSLQRLEAGTWIIAEGPYGAVTSQRRTRRDVLLIAGGVGITPMRALFETLPVAEGQDVLLLYRVPSPTEIVFRHELEAIATGRGVRLLYLFNGPWGRFSPENISALVPNVADRDVFLCASPRMSASVRTALRQCGLPQQHLHEERFDL